MGVAGVRRAEQSSPSAREDAACEPRRGNAAVAVVVCALVASPPGPAGAPVPGALPRRDDRGRELLLDGEPLHPPEPGAGPVGGASGTVGLVELPGLFSATAEISVSGVRGTVVGVDRGVGGRE